MIRGIIPITNSELVVITELGLLDSLLLRSLPESLLFPTPPKKTYNSPGVWEPSRKDGKDSLREGDKGQVGKD